ncbi:FecR family protein [Winogradskyella eckloniae]|uniref:FecR family protein n=1 Tax=Winogradskyella eckloniae TaxID=1089306 RepID=UPI0015657EB8|nr:FecR family protein [Winogradskyella eckloniae]NRD20103.1 FecR family protein [Winogradskyella eckloniae]
MDNKFTKDNLIARWLENRLNDDEKKALEDSGELDALKVVVGDIDTWKVEKMDVEKGLNALNERKAQTISITPTQSKKSSFWLSIAASVLLLLSSGYIVFNYFSNQTITITTAIAENKSISLPDGSIVKLDALSRISYNEKDWDENRTIQLNGQAYFDVTSGNTFIVQTNNGNITVLGTEFNVHTEEQIFEVTCYEGKVKVVYKTDEELLTQGQSVHVKDSRLINKKHTSLLPEWLEGYSKYNNVNLLTIIKDLEKYYPTTINLPKPYHNLQFTGSITHSDFNAAIETLFTAMEIKYSVSDNNSVTFN